MDHSGIQYQLRKNMCCSESYDYEKMWAKYIKVRREYIQYMTADEARKHPLMKPRTFKDLINLWAKAPDGWLIKKGVGKNARFYKRKNYIWRCHMSQNKLIARVAKKLRGMKRSVKWKW